MLIVWLPRFGGGGGGSSSSSSVVDGVIVASDRTDSSSESDLLGTFIIRNKSSPDSTWTRSFRGGAGAGGVGMTGDVAMILSSSLFDLCSS